VAVRPGERIRYVISDAAAAAKGDRVRAVPLLSPDTPYDTDKYTELLCKAAETLLWHHGYDWRRLRAFLAETVGEKAG
jgi:DNA polymerase elongation subunit (family B)